MTKLLRALLVFRIFQRFSAESLAAECQLGTIHEQSSLVQRNHTSTKVMLVSDAVIRTDRSYRSRLFSEAFLASCGKHMVLALSGAFPEQGSFPLEVFLPVGLLLAMLGCFLVTRDNKDAKMIRNPEQNLMRNRSAIRNPGLRRLRCLPRANPKLDRGGRTSFKPRPSHRDRSQR